ncbi:MAG: DUF5723 family protein [Bacteroidales bacterium]
MKQLVLVTITAFLILSFAKISKGQSDMTSYFMDAVPQSQYENPAQIPDVKWHFSFPALSSNYIEVANSGFHFQDVIENRGDSSYLLLDELVNEKLNESNHMALFLNNELLSFGFRAMDNMYFNFSVNNRTNFRLTYPKELFALPYNGNAAYIGEKVELEPFSLKATDYTEMALGVAREEPGKWSAGLRFKLLFGRANIWTENVYASLKTEEQGYDITAEAELLTRLTMPPGVDLMNPDSIGEPNIEDFVFNTSNTGIGIDFGFNYFISEDVSLSASVIDLGSINFNQNTYKYGNERTEVTFEGFDAYDYINLSDSATSEKIDNTVDSIAQKFNMEMTREDYSMPLTTRFYLGGQFHINDKQQAGLLFRGQYFNGDFWPAITASYNHRFGRIFSLSASYTATHDSYLNVGLGGALNMGPIQLYVISDNWMAAFRPEQTKYFNLHFGLNVAIRHKKDKTKPMFIEED